MTIQEGRNDSFKFEISFNEIKIARGKRKKRGDGEIGGRQE